MTRGEWVELFGVLAVCVALIGSPWPWLGAVVFGGALVAMGRTLDVSAMRREMRGD